MINPSEFVALQKVFNKIDKDMSGTIEVKELQAALRNQSKDQQGISEEDVERIIKQIDYDDNGMINYHEFIQVTFPVQEYLTEEKISSVFSKFDVDGDGHISITNLKDAFTKLGHELTDIEIREIFQEHDKDGDKRISR